MTRGEGQALLVKEVYLLVHGRYGYVGDFTDPLEGRRIHDQGEYEFIPVLKLVTERRFGWRCREELAAGLALEAGSAGRGLAEAAVGIETFLFRIVDVGLMIDTLRIRAGDYCWILASLKVVLKVSPGALELFEDPEIAFHRRPLSAQVAYEFSLLAGGPEADPIGVTLLLYAPWATSRLRSVAGRDIEIFARRILAKVDLEMIDLIGHPPFCRGGCAACRGLRLSRCLGCACTRGSFSFRRRSLEICLLQI